MFATIEITDFPLQALLRLRPELREGPVALLTGEGRRATVGYVGAQALGLKPGVSAAQAMADCPGIRLLLPSPDAEREAGAVLLATAWSLSPRVEPSAPGRCTIDLTGVNATRLPTQIERVRQVLEADLLSTRSGIAGTPLVARYAAFVARPVLHVGDHREFLAPLPVSILELTESESRLLADLGLHTLRSITAFPRAALTSRLGARGDELWSKAAGEWRVPIQPAAFPTRHTASLDLEEPLETLEPLLFVLRRLSDRLAHEVGQFGGGTSRLRLTLTLDNEQFLSRDFDLPEPTANPNLLFAVLENHLASLQTDSPVVAVALEVFPARRLERQEGFFDTGLRDAPLFYATLGRLCAVVGTDNVGTPRRRDSHRADDLTLVPPAATIPERTVPAAPEPRGPLLWRLRPPVPATVELTEARPTFLTSDLVAGTVTILRRPFRQNGEWWAPHPWAREEWDVRVGPGLYRLLHEPRGWFIEGLYD